MGYAWGTSNWTASSPGAPNVSGSLSLAQRIDIFAETGSFFAGLQGGYNYMLPNRLLFGGEVDANFPTFPDRNRISTGGISNLTSPTLGAETYSETVLASGTVRGHIGYAPGSWLFYATGGFAWTYNQQSLTRSPRAPANRRSCGDWVTPPEPASKHRSRRIGRRGLNICLPVTAIAARRSLAARSTSIPTFRCNSCAPV